jgi:hypothetical protein
MSSLVPENNANIEVSIPDLIAQYASIMSSNLVMNKVA